MNTKPAQTIPTAFPTCGEVFRFLVDALDLRAWGDIYTTSGEIGRPTNFQKIVSENLSKWANEPGGRSPTRADFPQFIHDQASRLFLPDDLRDILAGAFMCVMREHEGIIRENATYLGRADTRSWYGRGKAPDALYHLYKLRKLLRRLPYGGGPMLAHSLADLLNTTWHEKPRPHPLMSDCFAHYAKEMPHEGTISFAEGAADWRAGKTRPSFLSLSDCFRGHPRLSEIMLNFGIAHLVEALIDAFVGCVQPGELGTARDLLIRQARCLEHVDAVLANEQSATNHYGSEDYSRYLTDCLAAYRSEVTKIVDAGDAALLDVRWADLSCYRDYYLSFSRMVTPVEFTDFQRRLSMLWKGTALHNSPSDVVRNDWELAALRRDFPRWIEPVVGPLLAIEARLVIAREAAPTATTLLGAWDLYRRAVQQSRYQAGVFTKQVLREGLGLAALIQRGGLGEGLYVLPWITNTLAWWDLIGHGEDFDHEQEAQRVERASRMFIDSMHNELRKRWRAALPPLGLDHHYICGGLFGIIEPEAVARMEESVDKRQRQPLPSATTGRDQDPLMEALDRNDLEAAREFLRKGAKLNFINSTGDTCVTKAFARNAYDLVLEILRRDENPILRKVLLRETNNHKHSALELAVTHGRVDVLRELAKWKPGRGDVIDLSEERIYGGQTVLYYAVGVLVFHRISPGKMEAYVTRVLAGAPGQTKASEFIAHFLKRNPDASRWLKLLKENTDKNGYPKHLGFGNPGSAGEVISYLVNELQVDLELTNTNRHTALTLAVENGLHDVALQLLEAGANVNHLLLHGSTALAFAVINDDCEMARLLLEYGANYRQHLEVLGRPIYALPMSNKMRQMIPYRGEKPV